VLHFIGLTAGEAFVVAYIAVFIITAQFWPRLGARAGEWFGAKLASNSGSKVTSPKDGSRRDASRRDASRRAVASSDK